MKKFFNRILFINLLVFLILGCQLPGSAQLVASTATDDVYNPYELTVYQSVTCGYAPLSVDFEAALTSILPPREYSGPIQSRTGVEPIVSGPYVKYIRWDFGDGTGSQGVWTIRHTFHNPGDYTVACTVNVNGYVYISRVTVTVTVDTPIPNGYQLVHEFRNWPWDNYYCDITGIHINPVNHNFVVIVMTKDHQNPWTYNGIGVYQFTNGGIYIGRLVYYGTANGQLPSAQALAIDGSGNIYVADHSGYIHKFDLNGSFIRKWYSHDAGLGNNINMVIDKNNTLHVIDSRTHLVKKFDLNGNFLSQWCTGLNVGGLLNIAVNSTGKVYISNSEYNRVYVYDSAGNPLESFGGFGSQTEQFFRPLGIAIDQYDSIFVADCYNHRVQVFDRRHNFVTQFMTNSSYRPCFITFDQNVVYLGEHFWDYAVDTPNVKIYLPVW